MNNSLNVRISSRSSNNQTVWQGTATIPGLKPSRIVGKSTNSTEFSTRSAVLTSARNLAKSLGFNGIVEAGTTAQVKSAAKKSVKTVSVKTPSKKTSSAS